jgi:hypothetical protein
MMLTTPSLCTSTNKCMHLLVHAAPPHTKNRPAATVTAASSVVQGCQGDGCSSATAQYTARNIRPAGGMGHTRQEAGAVLQAQGDLA